MLIRQMCAGDVAAVADIESEFPSPWTIEQIFDELERTTSFSLVAETESRKIVGWCCGLSVAPDCELLKIAVCDDWQRLGVATSLLKSFRDLSVQKGADKSFLEVRSTNTSAIEFYEQLGWSRVGKRSKYYSQPPDDAYIFVHYFKG